MWTGVPWLRHCRPGAALNLKPIDPMTVGRMTSQPGTQGHAPLAAVEGLIRQILGGRKYGL